MNNIEFSCRNSYCTFHDDELSCKRIDVQLVIIPAGLLKAKVSCVNYRSNIVHTLAEKANGMCLYIHQLEDKPNLAQIKAIHYVTGYGLKAAKDLHDIARKEKTTLIMINMNPAEILGAIRILSEVDIAVYTKVI